MAKTTDLILMSCSHQAFDERWRWDKQGQRRELTALERYDGPWYRTLKSWVKARGDWPEWLELYVLTSKYGMIHRDDPCPWYDIKERDSALLARISHQVLPKLYDIAHDETIDVQRILYCGGRDSFSRILQGLPRLFPKAEVDWNLGRIGEQCHHMLDWLNSHKEVS